MDTNDIAVHPAKRQIILGDGTTYEYGIAISTSSAHAIRRTQACVLRAPPKSTTIWPGEFIELDCKDPPDCELALEPCTDCTVNILGQQNNVWPLPFIELHPILNIMVFCLYSLTIRVVFFVLNCLPWHGYSLCFPSFPPISCSSSAAPGVSGWGMEGLPPQRGKKLGAILGLQL